MSKDNYYRKCAVERAEAELSCGKDWQEVQDVLLNNPLYSMFFPSATDGGMADETDENKMMSIIREAENNLGIN